MLGNQFVTLAVGLALLLGVGLAVRWLRSQAGRPGGSYLAHRTTVGLIVVLSWLGLACVSSALWGFLGVLALLVVAMAVCGVAVLVMLLRGV